MITIEKYIQEVFGPFKAHLDSNIKLCSLKSVNYDLNQLPDYSDIHIQEYYLLRYAFAYTFEYRLMFSSILEKIPWYNPNPTLKILSIGCGNGLDYWSAVSAATHKGLNSKIKYLGIDIIEWKYRFCKREHDEMSIEICDAVEYLKSKDELDCNIIVFPKSISEFSADTFKEICNSLKRVKFPSYSLRLLISVRSTDSHTKKDMDRVAAIVKALQENEVKRFVAIDDYLGPCVKLEKVGIRSIDKDFKYPENAKECLFKLDKMCESYKLIGRSCQDCDTSKLTRKPIFTTEKVAYKRINMREA
jgi:hypothetical protein